jgi:AmiR/NasT family two-component response regulator
VIGQAKGILVAILGVSSDKAFALIVEQSQNENRKVSKIAAKITAGAQPRR